MMLPMSFRSGSIFNRVVGLGSLSALGLLVLLVACSDAPPSPQAPQGYRLLRDLDYVGQGHPRQRLDLYLPQRPATKPRPVVVFVHGGGWREGHKNDVAVLDHLITPDWVGVSLGYRLTDECRWPAPLHDLKAALRWLRAHAAEHQLDAQRVALFGISAGGQLVSMLGATAGQAEFEGSLGLPGPSVKLACVIDFCGPTDFLRFPEHAGNPKVLEDGRGAVGRLLGGPLSKRMDAAREASPMTHARAGLPPFLIIHGTADSLVPLAQSQEFDVRLDTLGVPSILLRGEGGPHVFFNASLIAKMREFLRATLQHGSLPAWGDGTVEVP